MEDISPRVAVRVRSSPAWGGSEHVTPCWVSVVPPAAGKTPKFSTYFSFLAKFVGYLVVCCRLPFNPWKFPWFPCWGRTFMGEVHLGA